MAKRATPLVEALVAIIDAARAYLRRTGSARTSSSPRCSRRPTIRELSRRARRAWSSGGGELDPAGKKALYPVKSFSAAQRHVSGEGGGEHGFAGSHLSAARSSPPARVGGPRHA